MKYRHTGHYSTRRYGLTNSALTPLTVPHGSRNDVHISRMSVLVGEPVDDAVYGLASFDAHI